MPPAKLATIEEKMTRAWRACCTGEEAEWTAAGTASATNRTNRAALTTGVA